LEQAENCDTVYLLTSRFFWKMLSGCGKDPDKGVILSLLGGGILAARG